MNGTRVYFGWSRWIWIKRNTGIWHLLSEKRLLCWISAGSCGCTVAVCGYFPCRIGISHWTQFVAGKCIGRLFKTGDSTSVLHSSVWILKWDTARSSNPVRCIWCRNALMSISMCHIRRVDHLFWMEFNLAIFFWRLGQCGCIFRSFLGWITCFLPTFLQVGSRLSFKLAAFCVVEITRFILVIRFDDPLGENTVWSLV